MVKVAFVGTHGMGKTALVYEQAARFKREGFNVEIVGEVARRCPLPINTGTSLEAQIWVLMTQIANEIEAGKNASLVICDRSVLDNFAYLKRVCKKPPTELVAWLAKWIESYDLLIKVPLVGKEIQGDGVRSTDWQFAKEIDELVGKLGHEFATARQRSSLVFDRANWNDEAYHLIKDRLSKELAK